MIACRRAGMRLRPALAELTPDVKRLVALGIPGIIAGGITQINILIATMIATQHRPRGLLSLLRGPASISCRWASIGVAIGVVLLPDCRGKLRAGDESRRAMDSQNRALELALFLTLPAAIALMVIPAPIVQTLFEHGAFTAADTLAVAYALAAFALGLPAFVMNKVFQPGFFAREDTKTPMRVRDDSVAVNIVGQPVCCSHFVRPCRHRAGHGACSLGQCLLALARARGAGITQPDATI